MSRLHSPRFEVEAGINGCLLVRDTYDSDLTSLTKHALGFLEQQSANSGMRRTLIVSDISGNELVWKMFILNLRQVALSGSVNRIIGIGGELQTYANEIAIEDKHFFRNTSEFLNSDIIKSFKDEAILFKVAPKFSPQRIQSQLQQLAHDTLLEINFDALFHNIDYFRSKLDTSTKLMCMVKASAYGSGSIEVALAMQHYGCNYLGVAFVNEGVELRQAGITMPIIVLDPMKNALNHLFTYNLEPEVCTKRMLMLLIEEANRHHLREYPIHIKLDTGMHRAGFEKQDLEEICQLLKHQNRLKVASVFSHLAAADDDNDEMNQFTLQQIETFRECSKELEECLGYCVDKHILNTAGIERFPEYQFNMVRLGIGLWGVNCRNQHLLRSVCSLSTKIMQIKHIKAGETVGYNRKGVITEPKEIALLPLGYADGINRKLGNGVGSLFYKGHRVPTVGNICMDLTMVDVTGLNAKEGDEVVIFSNNQRIDDMAKLLDTIPYEVLTSISPRVRRVYYRS